MQLNFDMNQIAQEQNEIIKICAKYEGCVECPMKKYGKIQMQVNTWSCENASKV